MKKKIIAISAAIAILAIAAVGGSLAWFTSSAAVTNTFTVGNVSITLDEATVDTYGKKIPDGQPGAGRGSSNSYHIIPGAVLDKDPTVFVNAGSESCLVYVLIENGLGSHAALDIDTTNWLAVSDYAGLYKYKDTVSAVTEKTPLPAVFKTVTIAGASLDNTTLATLTSKEIVVKAYAIQSANIGELDTAQMAWDAMTASP